MPWIENEIPSDEELVAYWRKSLHFLGAPNVSGPTRLCAYAEFGIDQWITEAQLLIFNALRKLNELPRSHPFWENTNRRPTIYKLESFLELMISEEPDSPTGRLAINTLPFLDQLWGVFVTQHWSNAFMRGEFHLPWLIYAAVHSYLVSGQETVDDLAVFLNERTLSEQSVSLLTKIVTTLSSHSLKEPDTDYYILQWSQRVLGKLA